MPTRLRQHWIKLISSVAFSIGDSARDSALAELSPTKSDAPLRAGDVEKIGGIDVAIEIEVGGGPSYAGSPPVVDVGGIAAVDSAVAVGVAIGDAVRDAIGRVFDPLDHFAIGGDEADDVAAPILAVVITTLERAVRG